MVFSQEEIDKHLRRTYSYSERGQELGECKILMDPREPEVQFNLAELQL